MRNEQKEKLMYYQEFIKGYTKMDNYTTVYKLAEMKKYSDELKKKELMNEIFYGNMYLVVEFIIEKYDEYNLDIYDIEELIQEGNLLLLRTIEKFDINKGTNFRKIFIISINRDFMENLNTHLLPFSLPSALKKEIPFIRKLIDLGLSRQEIINILVSLTRLSEKQAQTIYNGIIHENKFYLTDFEDTSIDDSTMEETVIDAAIKPELCKTIEEIIEALPVKQAKAVRELILNTPEDKKTKRIKIYSYLNMTTTAETRGLLQRGIRNIQKKHEYKLRKFL